MPTRLRMWPVVLAAIVALSLAATAPIGWADDDEDEMPFDVATVFFELNNTDRDLGIHALVDGEPWQKLEIEDPAGRKMLNIRAKGRLQKQGLTELFFESAEPGFDELAPEEFFSRFPEGEYEIEGVTLEGEELESTAEVTHLMPAPPDAVSVSGLLIDSDEVDCDEGPLPSIVVSAPVVTITWNAVTLSHPDLGRTNEPIEVTRYQVVVQREEPIPLLFSVDLPPSETSIEFPSGLFSSGEEWKFEILVREASGNQTAVESCFTIK